MAWFPCTRTSDVIGSGIFGNLVGGWKGKGVSLTKWTNIALGRLGFPVPRSAGEFVQLVNNLPHDSLILNGLHGWNDLNDRCSPATG
jgi:hypothetical protein